MDTLERVLQLIKSDPLPEAHTSSYWKVDGEQTVVTHEGGRVVLQGVGFGELQPTRWGLLSLIGRLSYGHVWACLESYPEVWKLTTRLAKHLAIGLTHDVWRQSMVLATLVDHWHAFDLHPRTFALIGDGYGILGALIHRLLPTARLYFIDLPKILIFQVKTMGVAAPTAKTCLLSSTGGEIGEINFASPENLEAISEEIDCTVNVTSMQEMTHVSITRYFNFLRKRSTRRSRFYCVNRLRKELPGGEVTEFLKYPWQEDDEMFIDGVCPYHTHFPAYDALPDGPRILGIRIPLLNAYGGVILHRLVRLSSLRRCAPDSAGQRDSVRQEGGRAWEQTRSR